jgi:IMP cyclohydrolase
MRNQITPYPGRQLFVGMTKDNKPAFTYLVTGRSPASRERRLREMENGIYNAPISDVPYDWLRHYPAVKYENTIGLMTVTNGIQTEAVFEMYRLLYHCGTRPTERYLKTIMDGAGYEPDSIKTPRIAGVITNNKEKAPVYLVGIKVADKPAYVWEIKPEAGILTGVATYNGSLKNPAPFPANKGPVTLNLAVSTPKEIADFLYTISAANYNGEDIRVCAIGGVRETNNTWQLAFINRYNG